MQVTTKWNLGNFTVSLSAEAEEKVQAKLMECGMRFLGQRVSQVDKVLGAFEPDPTKEGKVRRKKNWKRGDVEFTPELAAALAGVFSELVFPDDTKLKAEAVVVEYIPAVAEAKYETEKSMALKMESAGKLEEWLETKIGYTGPTHTDDGEEYATTMLAAIRAKIQEIQRKAREDALGF